MRTAPRRPNCTSRNTAWRPAKPASSTKATGCWAAAGSPERRADENFAKSEISALTPRPPWNT
ncbi:protein of unknown function [Azospirillum baldaniorum]|uniref:Uncharacterized protein n=1 Tax=Azospirillum baldaniorum TaxID=1064539 RepID=A0A9P1JQ49_9PROT|nr:protein of unknown function [Azospirillum baldaniorum]